jgi:hypothetical protein
MKYSLNHTKFFKSPERAFLIGFIQATVVFIVEIGNILVLLAAPDIIEVILNFVAISTIAEFDQIIFEQIKEEEELKTLLFDEDGSRNLLEIYHTTSRRAKGNLNIIEVPVVNFERPHLFDEVTDKTKMGQSIKKKVQQELNKNNAHVHYESLRTE